MAELKTKPGDENVDDYLAGLEPARREDGRTLVDLMRRVTGEEPRLWGGSMVGFGLYRYQYASGREGEWFICGFAPRKGQTTLYLMSGFEGRDEVLARLGKVKTGKSCLYVKRVADLDQGVLEELVREAVAAVRRTYPS